MRPTLETEVLVVGAGPVGLTLAMDLARRGVNVIVLERRERNEPPSVKCNHVAARSMEIFRRLGVVEEVRNAGLPVDFPHDIAFRTSFLGQELARVPIPARGERYTSHNGPDTHWPTPEPPHRINQIFLEPILFEHAWNTTGLSIINRTQFESFTQDEAGVVAHAARLDSSEELHIQARYLIGCDGGSSDVRHQIGAQLSGDAVIQRVQSTYIRAPKLLERLEGTPAWGNLSLNPRRSGTVYAIDGRETWLIHNYLKDAEPDFESIDRDWAIRTILGVGPGFDYEVISAEDWYGRRLIANTFHDGRVFICGDAAHLWVPYAGYGMNAGIADAENLSWMLAAHLHGWADERILNAHERERWPITDQVSRFAMNHAHDTARQRRGVPEEIEDATPEGEAARRAVGASTYELNVQQYAAAGLNFGYYYDDSPIIAYDGEQHPPYSMGSFTPATVPGCRTPHFWLSDGRSLYDAMGPGYTLLRFDDSIDVEPLTTAAAARNVPLKFLDVTREESVDAYSSRLLISRPDYHVAWRGDAIPEHPLTLIDLLRGS